MTNSKTFKKISFVVTLAIAFALLFTVAALAPVAQAEGPESFAVTLSKQYIDAAPWDSEPGASVGLTFPADLTFTPAITYDVNDTSNVAANFHAFDSSSSLVIMVRKAMTDDALLVALFNKGQDLAVTFNGHEQTYYDASNDFGTGVGYYHQYVSDYGTIVILLTDYTDNTYEADTISIQIVISNAAHAALQGDDTQSSQSGSQDPAPTAHVHDDITFTAWESTTSLPSSAGNYYLTQDVTISSSWNVPTGATNLCLNGHVISAASNVYISVVTIQSGATLNLYDCDTTTHYYYIDPTTYKQNRAPNHDKMYDIGEIAADGPTNSAYVAATKKGTFKGGYITGGTGQGLTSNSNNKSGGGFQIYGGGTLNMYGGCVFGNYTSATSSQGNEGGGVYVYQNGVFNMNGGYIIGNQGGNACGGVQNLGTFTMNDGYIGHNTAGDGGWANGGGIGNSGTMTMNGGVIEGNEAGAHGGLRGKCGGAIENNGSLTINGGSIINNFCDNAGGGIYMSNASASLTIGAGAKITGNYNDETQKADNVYLGANKVITIGSALTEEASVGVTLKSGTGVFTSGWNTYMSGLDPFEYFVSDNLGYNVVLSEGEVKLVEVGTIYVNNLQGTIKSFEVPYGDTIASVKATVAAAFGVTAADYKLTFGGEDLAEAQTVAASGITEGDTLYLVPVAGGLKTITLVPTATSTAAANAQGYYSAIQAGDTVTITYASTQNDGFSEAVFTTAFDEEYFHLTSVAVDTTYYELLNDYGHDGQALTLAEFIAEHNDALDAGEEPYTGRLSFFVTYKGGFDTEGALSDHFITVTYVATQDIPAADIYSFGFDMSFDGMFTNAAYDDEILLNIIDKDGVTVDDKMVTILVMGQTEVEIVEDQSIALPIDTAAIELTWIEPAFDQTNPYLADGGEVTYTFYTKNGNNEYVRVEDGEGQPIVPQTVGDYYVKATLADTDHYVGSETEIVAITVQGTTEVEIVEDQSIVLPIDTTAIELTWIEPDFDQENPYFADGGEVTYTFYTENANHELVAVVGFPTEPGDYFVKATLAATDHYVGSETDTVAITIMGTTALVITENQVLTFDRFGSEYFVNENQIEYTWTTPTGDPNPYIADGGKVTLSFYKMEGQTHVALASTQTGHPNITAAGTYYVKATLADSEHFVGSETDYVAFSVIRRKVDVPELKLYAGENSATAVGPNKLDNLTITLDSVPYGTTLSLKEIVESEEVAYTLADYNGDNIDDLSFYYQTGTGMNIHSYETNFFDEQPLSVGTYQLIIQPRDSRFIEFDADPVVQKIIITVTIVKAKVAAPTETTVTYTYTGEEQTYAFADNGDTDYFTVTGKKRTLAGEQTVTAELDDKDNYEWANGGTENVTFTFTIETKKVAAPTETTVTYTYTGEEQTYAFADNGDTDYFTVTGTKRTLAGEQTVTAELDDKDNYEWENGGTENVTFTFTIETKKVAAPTETTETYTYTGEEQTYAFADNGDTDYFTVTGTKRTLAGEQTVTAELDDKDNYEWENGGTENVTFTFTIAQKKLTIKTYIDDAVLVELTYGDAAPTDFDYEVVGILASEEEAVLEALTISVNAVDAAYAQFEGVGEYVYTAAVDGEVPANYIVDAIETAKITVSEKSLTLVASYEGGEVTFSIDGVVNDDDLGVAYKICGDDLVGDSYTAVAADTERSLTVSASITNANYETPDDLDLLAVKAVTFVVTAAFEGATDMPDAQYIFQGYLASQPVDPAYEGFSFSYWYVSDEAEAFDFANDAIEEDVVLTAKWEKMLFAFKFRALNDGADYQTGTYRNLKWDSENEKFILADTFDAYEFEKNTDIPMAATVGDFRVNRWVKAVKVNDVYTYTVVTAFEASVSSENDADAYYIAMMTLDLGKGDVNGNGEVTAEDVVLMKRFLVGVKFNILTDKIAVWNALADPVPTGGYFYLFLWDANGDTYKDTRDVITERRALVGGYGYEILSDVTVNGVYYSHQIIAEVAYVDSSAAFNQALIADKNIILLADITLGIGGFDTEGSLFIDLAGHTISMDEYYVTAQGSVTLKNGVLEIENLFMINGNRINFVDMEDECGGDILVTNAKHIELTAE